MKGLRTSTKIYVVKLTERTNEYIGQISGCKNKKIITVFGKVSALRFDNEHSAARFILKYGIGISLEVEPLDNPSSFDVFGNLKEFFRGNIDG